MTALFATKSKPAAATARVTAFVTDASTHEALATALADHSPDAQIHEGGLPAALAAAAQGPAPELAVVDVTGTEDPINGVTMLVSALGSGTDLIIVGTVNDVALYRELTEAGAGEYLVKPVSAESFTRAFADIEARRRGPNAGPSGDEAHNGKVITVMGTRGGVGATTFAVNMAWVIAHQTKRKVALIDLDLCFGTVALALDLEPTHGLRELLESPDRIDSLIISSALAQESDELAVLGAEEPLGERLRADAGAFDALLDDLRQSFDYLVIDLARNAAVPPDQVIDRSDKLVVVSDLSLAAMRDAVRLVAWIKSVTSEAQLSIALNKVGAGARGEVPKSEFERATQASASHVLPYDPKAAGAAASAGRAIPVAAKGSALAKALVKASLDISAAEKEKPGRRGLFRKK